MSEALTRETGVARLMECVALVLSKVEGIERQLQSGAARAEDATRPFTALELCDRWKIAGETPEKQLFNLARKCRAWGLVPLKGTRGWEALYGRGDVLHAETYAAGKLKRRKHA
jgi:hypothetical protein